MTHPADDLDIEIDLNPARRGAERVRDMLVTLRQRFDLSPFAHVTLSSFVFNDLALAAMYLHEQMHWYATWFSHAHPQQWKEIFRRLRQRYPQIPAIDGGGAQDEASTYLHLLVNWLELEGVSRLFARDEVERHLRGLPFYRWIYRLSSTISRPSQRSTASSAWRRSGPRPTCRPTI